MPNSNYIYGEPVNILRPLATTLTAAALAAAALTGCSSSTTATIGASASEVNLSGSPVSAADDMAALCKQIIAEALPLEAAEALADASGYVTRVGKIDGVGQAVTTDLREDRFTFETKDGLVVACTVG
jgi:hypothetical protein